MNVDEFSIEYYRLNQVCHDAQLNLLEGVFKEACVTFHTKFPNKYFELADYFYPSLNIFKADGEVQFDIVYDDETNQRLRELVPELYTLFDIFMFMNESCMQILLSSKRFIETGEIYPN